ncbi:MAG TPA: AIR synthase related protein [Candidatus Dormibacteraeota bacterium]|nr:AIR synthase related protein [Candidatus Dormibacteraeota bacterium]
MTTVGGIGESKLVELIKPYLAKQAGGDDAALLDPVDAYEVVSTDMAIEGVHFDLSWMSAEDAGWRALALALGDLAAKGAYPHWALASLAVPRQWKTEDFAGLFKGMHELASRFAMSIVGGDMGAIEGPAVLSLTVGGFTDDVPLPRSAAEAGWAVGVTGPLGKSAVALRERRVLRPEPLIQKGMELNALGICCGDISDGLVREMEKFAAMSGVGSTIRAADVPCAAGASVTDALTSGEEVELVCAGPPAAVERAGLHVVGMMVDGGRVEVVGAHLDSTGYDHFA